MTLSDLIAAIGTLGLPITQIFWPDGHLPDLPYIVLVPQTTEDVMADGSSYLELTPYNIELYTRYRDMDLEARLESALKDAGFPRQKNTLALDGAVEVVYSVTCVGK